MASTRKRYDQCSADLYYGQSTKPFLYRLAPDQNDNCNKCYSEYGPRSDMQVSYINNSNLVDIDSMLTNRTKVASDCKNGHVTNIDYSKYNKTDIVKCNNFLDRTDSLLTHPKMNYRGMTIDWYFEPLVGNRDPQCNLFWNFGENTRLSAKDNYKPRLPTPLDQTPIQPTQQPTNRRSF